VPIVACYDFGVDFISLSYDRLIEVDQENENTGYRLFELAIEDIQRD
jgi:hypothetical protein